jgi:hypothetical protein
VDAEVVELDGVARTPPWTLFEGGRLVLVELAAPDLYISRVWLVELALVSSYTPAEMTNVTYGLITPTIPSWQCEGVPQ